MKKYKCIKGYSVETVDGDCCVTGKYDVIEEGSLWVETEQRFKENSIWLESEDGTIEIGLDNLNDFEELPIDQEEGKECQNKQTLIQVTLHEDIELVKLGEWNTEPMYFLVGKDNEYPIQSIKLLLWEGPFISEDDYEIKEVDLIDTTNGLFI